MPSKQKVFLSVPPIGSFAPPITFCRGQKEMSNSKAGLGALLTPGNCALILIDHQPFQFAGLRSHDTQTVINNVIGLAKSAKIFGVPTLFTTVVQDRGGYLLKQLQDVLPEQKPIDRTFINTWEDARVVEW